jgi:MFS family permease
LLVVLAAGSLLVFAIWSVRGRDPFLEPRLFRDRVFSSAVLVSLLTGYAFATAIVGGALFVDRVLYGGPDEQRLALGALAGATALGALVSGFAIRVVSLRVVTLIGLAASIAGLALMARWDASVQLVTVAGLLALFGLGFGLTVTPRSTAAVEAAGSRLFGAASATVTVARMIGMAIGLAVLAAYGSTVIAGLYDKVYGTPDGYKAFIPIELRDRSLRDGLVVEALESWAASEASGVMVGLFAVAGGVMVAAAPAAFALGSRPRMLADAPVEAATTTRVEEGDGTDDEPAALAL